MIKIIQKTINGNTRSKLFEGRNYQMGFAFAKKLDEDTFQLVQPISPCKDYLNDVIFSELTGRKLSIHGCKSEKNDIFDKHAYLCFSIMPKKTTTDPYNGKQMSDEIENLSKTYLIIQKMINDVEDSFKVEERTEIFKVEDNLYLAIVPLYWTMSTWAISLYSLLIRAFQYVKEYVPFMPLLEEYPYYIEQMLVMQALPKIKFIAEKGFPKQDFTPYEKYSD